MASVRLTHLRLLTIATGIASGLMLPAHAAGHLGVVAKENYRDGGVLVVQVEPDGPADRAGIQPDDVIVRFGGRRIRAANELTAAVEAAVPGRQIEVQIVREGREMTLPVAFGRKEANAAEDDTDPESNHRNSEHLDDGPHAPDIPADVSDAERAKELQLYYDAWDRAHQRVHEKEMLEKEKTLVEAQQHLVEAQQHLLETQDRLLVSEWDQRPQLAMARLCYQTFWECLLDSFAPTRPSDDIAPPVAGGREGRGSQRTHGEAF